MADPRTFKIDSPLMEGSDVEAWEQVLFDRFRDWNIQYPIDVDGKYGVDARSATASFMRAWGVESAQEAMQDGLTPDWRVKLRNDDRTAKQKEIFASDERVDYRRALRERFDKSVVCYPVPNLITDDWGYHPGMHDGVDLVCPWKQPILAICDGIVRRVSAGGWWGKGAVASAGHPISDGDGIVIIESTIDSGPFARGLKFGYGHSEYHVVAVGQRVRAGDLLGHAGWARAPHVHFMVNDDAPVDGFYRGVGDRDPMPYLDYARKHD